MYNYTLHITGMTCGGCASTVQRLLLTAREGISAEIDLLRSIASVRSPYALAQEDFVHALAGYPKYTVVRVENTPPQHIPAATMPISIALPVVPLESVVNPVVPFQQDDTPRSWFSTYKPIVLIFGYVGVLSVLLAMDGVVFSVMTALRVFMAGFFLVFSFFKLLDVKAFAESYAMYDIVAKRFSAWGSIYPFVELGLGFAFVVDIFPVAMNWITLAVMSVSMIGVLQQVLNKRAIRCACLGTVFQLPMSTVTIIEDGLMIVMSIAMIILHS